MNCSREQKNLQNNIILLQHSWFLTAHSINISMINLWGFNLFFSVFTQKSEEVLHIVGEGGFEGDDFFRGGVFEGNSPGVEGAACDNGSFGGRVGVF
jgi:hypothetical protein